MLNYVWVSIYANAIEKSRNSNLGLPIVKSSLYLYIKCIGFGWVEFYDISTIIGYLMPNPLYTYTLNI